MNSKNNIQTDKNLTYKQELNAVKLDNIGLDIKQLYELMRMFIPSQEPERFYSREKTAEILDISVEQLDILRKNGKIAYRKIERLIKYSKSDIVEFQQKCRIKK